MQSLRRNSQWRAVHQLTAVTLVALALSTAAAAQSPTAASQTIRQRRTLISLNPLGLPFEYVAGELEQKVTGIATIGLAASYLGAGDASYTSLEAKLRLYPNEEAFKGFSIGIAAGLSRLSESYFGSSATGVDNSATRPTIAVITDYNWLLGKSKRVLVGAGVGAKRIFGSDSDFSDINFAYPTGRFQIGMIF